MINNLSDFIKAVKLLLDHSDIDEAVRPDGNYKMLTSSSNEFLKTVSDNKLITALEEIEFSVSYYFFTEAGLMIQSAVKKLANEKIKLIKLETDHSPFTHGLQTDKFCIPFTV